MGWPSQAALESRWLIGRVLVGDKMEFQPEAAPLSGFRFDTGLSFHSVHDFTHEGQPDTRAFLSAIEPLEHMENAFMLFFWNPDTVIFDPQPNSTVLGLPFGPDTDLRDFARTNKLYSIGQKVGKALR